MNLEFKFEDEIAVVLARTEKRVGRLGHRNADYISALGAIVGLAAFLHPAGEVLAIEQADPTGVRVIRGTGCDGNGQQNRGCGYGNEPIESFHGWPFPR